MDDKTKQRRIWLLTLLKKNAPYVYAQYAQLRRRKSAEKKPVVNIDPRYS